MPIPRGNRSARANFLETFAKKLESTYPRRASAIAASRVARKSGRARQVVQFTRSRTQARSNRLSRQIGGSASKKQKPAGWAGFTRQMRDAPVGKLLCVTMQNLPQNKTKVKRN